MKSIKNTVLSLTIATLTLGLGAGHAAALWANDSSVEGVRWYPKNNGFGFITLAEKVGPEGCNSAHMYFNASMPGYEQVVSIALAAQLSGKPVRVLVSDTECTTDGHPTLKGIIITK